MESKIITSLIAVLVTLIVGWLILKAINKRKKMVAKWKSFLQEGVEVDGTLSNFSCDIHYKECEMVSSVAKGTLNFVTKDGDLITRDWIGHDVYPTKCKPDDKIKKLVSVKVIYNKDNVNDNVVKEVLVGYISRYKNTIRLLWFCLVAIIIICFLLVASYLRLQD